jgi:DNA-binding MarR family transcriptional regulator/GNAT superfamily N-acetyltransferase
MDGTAVEQVRSFNRTVTQRVGALQDEYLAHARPLGASRVLWEAGAARGGRGADVRALRARLDLDSGYLSRLLRRLEAEGLVTVGTDPADQRARLVRLTPAGRRERRLLDRQSDQLAASLLAPLSERQRDRLVAAMGTVERLLTAGLVEVSVDDPAGPDGVACLEAYYAELDERFDDGFDPLVGVTARPEELVPPAGLFLVARLHGEPVGCGGLKLHGRQPAEVKRMWVSPSVRGLGVGRRLLAALEDQARARAVRVLHLETSRHLTAAIALYRSAGYVEVPAFNDQPGADHWFEKHLPRP